MSTVRTGVVDDKLAAIDYAIESYETALRDIEVLEARAGVLKAQLTELVELHGVVPANAKSMKRLQGAKRSATLTYSSSTVVNAEAVGELKTFLDGKGFAGFFQLFFARQEPPVYVPPPPSYRRVLSPDVAFADMTLPPPAKIRAKVFELYAKCVTARPNKPALKVEPAKVLGETKND